MPHSAALDQAIAALEAGRTVESQRLLAQVVSQEPNNEEAWLWLAEALDEPERKRFCIRQALALNPASEVGLRLLAELDRPTPAGPAWVEAAPSTWSEAALPTASAALPTASAALPTASAAVPVWSEVPAALPAWSEAPLPAAPAASPDKLLEQALALIEKGHRDEGLYRLEDIVRRYPNYELAWLGLAATTIDPDKKEACVARALEINPRSKMGRKLRRQLDQEAAAAAEPERGEDYWGPGAWLAALAPSTANYASILSDSNVSVRRACWWMALASMAGYFIIFLARMFMALALGQVPHGQNVVWALLGILVCGWVPMAVSGIVSLLVVGGLLFGLGLLLGGRGAYTDVVYAQAAYLSPLLVLGSLFALVPLAGPGLLGLLGLYGAALNVVAVKVAHRLGWGRALLVSFSPWLVGAGVAAALAFVFVAALGSGGLPAWPTLTP